MYFTAKELLKHVIDDGEMYHLYIFDIEMPEDEWFAACKRNPENRCQSIVCIPDWIYAVCYGCFEVITFDYISKPITVEKLESVLLKAMQYLHMIKA